MAKFKATANAEIRFGLHKTLNVPFTFIFNSKDINAARFAADEIISDVAMNVKVEKIDLGEPIEADFFSIVTDKGNEKYIHLRGYTYKSENNDWRAIECTWLIKSLSVFVREFAERGVEYVDEIYEETKEYESVPISDEQMLNYINGYFDGECGTRLDFNEINMDTPCGHYYNSDAPKIISIDASSIQVTTDEQ